MSRVPIVEEIHNPPVRAPARVNSFATHVIINIFYSSLRILARKKRTDDAQKLPECVIFQPRSIGLHRHRSRMLTKRPLPRVSGARATRRPIRLGTGGARAKFHRKQPLGVLNRGTEALGVEDVSTPSNSSRARRRTQKEVHGAVRTRAPSVRLTTTFATPRVIDVLALPSPCRPTLDTVERGRRQLTDEERIQLATVARYARHTGTVTMAELARVWKMSPKALYGIINRQRLTGSAAALRRTGPAHLLTDADEEVLAWLSEELDGNYTWDEMTKRFNEETGKEVSTMTVFRFCKTRATKTLKASSPALRLTLSPDKKV